MATIDDLKSRIDLHDLADFLGLKRGKGEKANYFSPQHEDKSPSLSIYRNKQGQFSFKDHSTGQVGSCVDLLMYVRGCDVGEAVKQLHGYLNIPLDRPNEPKREKTRVEYIADRCLEHVDRAMEYLTQARAIPERVARRAIERRMVGFNTWESDKVAAGEHGHGGPAVAFIVRSNNPGHVVAVDLRYLDPAINGGTKTQCQGEKAGYPWVSDFKRLQTARTVYVVESPINALSVEAADMPYTAAVATRGTGNVASIDWRFLQGKQVILCMDHDEPDDKGRCPGLAAAWQLNEILTGLDIASLLVDQDEWEVNDINDALKDKGPLEAQILLKKIEPWLIPGMAGKGTEQLGRPRVYLPGHDFAHYWRYRVKPDFTSFVSKFEDDDEGGRKLDFTDLCGFRVAAISRVKIASAVATMTGEEDSQPKVMFAVSVQTPRHGPALIRRVLEDERLHNVDVWGKLGPVFAQGQFKRMVNILERTADIGARNATNFVGLAYREGRLVVNEGPNCYFTQPEQQCPYHNLIFPSGSAQDARVVIRAYQATFQRSAAAIPLVWGLGGHLKVLLGFWPHLMMQSSKGSGKSTLIKRLERTIAMTMFSGQSLQTEFRLLTSISHTSHPVGWEELSARRQEVIDKAVGILQECYQYTVNRRGPDLTEFLLSAPVLLAGEDVPIRSLIGKVVRTELSGKKGPLMPEDMPRFPVRQWLEFLSKFNRAQVSELYEKRRIYCLDQSRASGEDDGAVRMAGNYAAILTAWRLLCEFADMEVTEGNLREDVIAEMNAHISETSADREPWVWILETLLSEIATSNFRHPYCWGTVDDAAGNPYSCLIVRTSHVMDHLAHTSSLRDKWNGLPVKSDRVFKKELKAAGIVVSDTVERTIGGDGLNGVPGKRVSHMSALSIERMAKYGLYAVGPESAIPASSNPAD